MNHQVNTNLHNAHPGDNVPPKNNQPQQQDGPQQHDRPQQHDIPQHNTTTRNTITIISAIFAIIVILSSSIYGLDFLQNLNSPSFLDTTELVEGLHDSFEAISKLGDIDLTPLNTFSSAIWDANKIITKSKLDLQYLLADTNLSTEHKQELMAYFDNIDDLFTNMSDLSDISKSYYAEETAAIGTFISDTNRMQRMLKKYNFHGIMMQIDYFLEHVEETRDRMHALRQEWHKYKKKAMQYHKQAAHHKWEMKYEQKEAEKKAAAIPESEKARFNNPYERLKFVLFGSYEDIYGNPEKEKLIEMAMRFQKAEDEFNVTAHYLDECVNGIENILNGMTNIQKEMTKSRRKMERARVEGMELNNLMRNRIESADYEELHESLNSTLYHFKVSDEKYTMNSANVIMITD